MKPWEIPGVRLRVLNNSKSDGGLVNLNDESKDMGMIVLGSSSSKGNSFEQDEKNKSGNKNEKQQLVDWNEIEKGRPWFMPNHRKGEQGVTSIIRDAKGQAPRRCPPNGKRKALKPPRVAGGVHTFLNRYVQHYRCNFSLCRCINPNILLCERKNAAQYTAC